MLAEMSNNLEEVYIQQKGATSLEYKLDGARVQIHLKKGRVEIFSRQLTKVTKSLPEIIEVTKKKIRADEAVLEGEVVAYGDDDKPLPFQTLMKRFRRIHQIKAMTKEVALRLYLFDILYLNGKTLIDKPYNERRQILTAICEPNILVEQIITDNVSEAKTFLLLAIKHGHEGLIAKELNSNYIPGKRGKKWFKIKTIEYLDLVIAAADWGYGRRTGWLSNYHLAAWDEEAGEYQKVGKTFKGLTDDEFREMTTNLLKIKNRENRSTVFVKPKIVVEVAFNEIQSSPHYKSGFALRFARITRIRSDKNPENADTIDRIKKMYDNQFKFKARFQPK
jgi:DNA ligase-1